MLITLLIFGLQYTLVFAAGLQKTDLHTSCMERNFLAPVHLVPPLNHCETAINMIPSGNVVFRQSHPGTGRILKPFDAHLDHPGDWRKVLLPAVFIYKSCSITVRSKMEVSGGPHGPANASTMFFIVWPEVRTMAGSILKKCLRERNGVAGSLAVKILLEGSWLPLNVLLVHDWAVSREPFEGYHIYDADMPHESSIVPNAGEFLPSRGG